MDNCAEIKEENIKTEPLDKFMNDWDVSSGQHNSADLKLGIIKSELLVTEEMDIKSESRGDADCLRPVLQLPISIPTRCSDICGCRSAEKLQFDPRTHKPLLYECRTCNLKSVCKSSFDEHKSLHVGDNWRYCVICGCKCLSRAALDAHLRKHTSRKLHKCSMCNFKTVYKVGLQRHMRVHESRKFFLTL